MPVDKPTKEELKYWNDLLRDEGLAMSQGANPDLVYSGTNDDLSDLEASQVAETLGCGDGYRVSPSGAKPE